MREIVKSNVSETLQDSPVEELGSFLYATPCITCRYPRLLRHVFPDMSWYDVCPQCHNEFDDDNQENEIEDDK